MQHSRQTKTPYFHTYDLSTPREKYRMDGVVLLQERNVAKAFHKKQTNQNKQAVLQLHDVPNRALRFATADSALAVLRTEPEAAAVPVVLLGTCLVDLVAVASRGRWPVTAAPAPAVAARRLLWRLLAPSSFAHRFMRCAYDASLCSSAWMRH